MFRKFGIALVMLIAWGCLSCPAVARYKAQYAQASPKIHAWYESQHNALGQSCCLSADGHDYYGNVTFNKDGSVVLDGGYKVPSFMVLHGPNPTGHGVWFYMDGYGGRTTFCFALPTMG